MRGLHAADLGPLAVIQGCQPEPTELGSGRQTGFRALVQGSGWATRESTTEDLWRKRASSRTGAGNGLEDLLGHPSPREAVGGGAQALPG